MEKEIEMHANKDHIIEIPNDNTHDTELFTLNLRVTLFNLVFLREHNKMNTTPHQRYLWKFLAIGILCIQVFCLIVLSRTFLESWMKDYEINGAIYVDNQLYKDRSYFINASAPLYFLASVASLMATGSYLLKTAKPFLVSLGVYFSGDVSLHSRWDILLTFLNFAVIISTWQLTIFVAFYGLYFKIDSASDIILISFGNVFILEIDDYICEWFTSSSPVYTQRFWQMTVDKTKYTDKLSAYSICALGIIIINPIASSFEASYNFGYAVDQFGIDVMRTTVYISYVSAFCFSMIVMIPAYTRNKKTREHLVRLIWIALTLAEIIVLGEFWFSKDEWSSVMILWIPSILILIILICLDLNGNANKVFTLMFITLHVALVIVGIVQRIESNIRGNKGLYTLLALFGCLWIRYYGPILYLV